MSIWIKNNVVIPLTHHKNSGYTKFKVLGVYLSTTTGVERYWVLNYPFVYRIVVKKYKAVSLRTLWQIQLFS